MIDFTFTGLWLQTPGNPASTFTWRGLSPVDALVRQWATCLPDTAMGSPLRCEADGHVYHLALVDGDRQITVLAVAAQGHAETF